MRERKDQGKEGRENTKRIKGGRKNGRARNEGMRRKRPKKSEEEDEIDNLNER